MEDVFWTRTMIHLKTVELLVMAVLPAGVSDQRISKIMQLYRELTEQVLPHQGVIRKQSEERLKTLMATPEFMKPMQVVGVEQD